MENFNENFVHFQIINYFKISKGQFLIQGQPIKCADCEKIFQSVICPNCYHLNPFVLIYYSSILNNSLHLGHLGHFIP